MHELDFAVFENSPSVFSLLLDEDNKTALDAFIKQTNNDFAKSRPSKVPDLRSSKDSFLQIDKSVRKVLKTIKSSDYLKKLDRELQEFIQSPTSASI
jgi:hypothetical protein